MAPRYASELGYNCYPNAVVVPGIALLYYNQVRTLRKVRYDPYRTTHHLQGNY